ncbi:hypothetical protein LZ318_19320 [Saccharopolyspora indica]|uniref:hypothetical protein n=1 Tax=Saccharopolyspora indica TaxID=1229659 RepID=UPI0022EB2E76|nr:hypothetical protein [Saccharopolyspora indica]MDA3643134.1 hypothetical protein [Saccharopolyspora indica]
MHAFGLFAADFGDAFQVPLDDGELVVGEAVEGLVEQGVGGVVPSGGRGDRRDRLRASSA